MTRHASSRLAGFVLVLLLGVGVVAHAAPSAADLDRLLAREPAEVVPASGRTVRGLLDGFRDGRLHLRLATDGGEVGYSFAPAEMARLTLPGAELEAEALELLERGDLDEALPRLEALGRQRVRYLPVLDATRQQVLWTLAAHAGAATDPHAVRAILRAMAPLADAAEKRLALLEAELELALRSGTADDVRPLAERWCVLADPAGPSALGWRVLARLAYEDADYERARWLALQPVTFAGHAGARDLDRCYALAIAAAEAQGDAAHAAVLRAEMAARGLAAPSDEVFSTPARAPAPEAPGGATRSLDAIRKTPTPP